MNEAGCWTNINWTSHHMFFKPLHQNYSQFSASFTCLKASGSSIMWNSQTTSSNIHVSFLFPCLLPKILIRLVSFESKAITIHASNFLEIEAEESDDRWFHASWKRMQACVWRKRRKTLPITCALGRLLLQIEEKWAMTILMLLRLLLDSRVLYLSYSGHLIYKVIFSEFSNATLHSSFQIHTIHSDVCSIPLSHYHQTLQTERCESLERAFRCWFRNVTFDIS